MLQLHISICQKRKEKGQKKLQDQRLALCCRAGRLHSDQCLTDCHCMAMMCTFDINHCGDKRNVGC